MNLERERFAPGGAPEIRVTIADDQAVFLKELRGILDQAPGVRVLAEALDGATAWDQIQSLRPDVAILDLEMPEMDGLGVAQRVQNGRIPVRLIILTLHNDETLFQKAIEIGVSGYLLKEDAMTEVLQCLRAVDDGNQFITPALSTFISRPGVESMHHASVAELSSTQREVLKLVGDGLTNRQIAEALGIGSKTVENHRARIAEKLGLESTESWVEFVSENRDRL